MPKIDKWEDWDDVEDKVHEDIVRDKINHKEKYNPKISEQICI